MLFWIGTLFRFKLKKSRNCYYKWVGLKQTHRFIPSAMRLMTFIFFMVFPWAIDLLSKGKHLVVSCIKFVFGWNSHYQFLFVFIPINPVVGIRVEPSIPWNVSFMRGSIVHYAHWHAASNSQCRKKGVQIHMFLYLSPNDTHRSAKRHDQA